MVTMSGGFVSIFIGLTNESTIFTSTFVLALSQAINKFFG